MRFISVLLVILAVAAMLTLAQTPHPSFSGEAKIGGAFTLTDTRGRTVKDTDFRGRLMLVYMGYSHCPDICPMTLATLSDTLKALGPDADKVAVLFISLDPERDTPVALGKFLKAFDPRIVGLTGTPKQVKEAAGAYRVFFQKSATPGTGSYLIDHSGFLYLMDGQGKYLAHFPSDTTAGTLTKALKERFQAS